MSAWQCRPALRRRDRAVAPGKRAPHWWCWWCTRRLSTAGRSPGFRGQSPGRRGKVSERCVHAGNRGRRCQTHRAKCDVMMDVCTTVTSAALPSNSSE